MSVRDPKQKFWQNVIKAVGAEPVTGDSIQGSSGFSHPVIALGVDRQRQRIVIISGEGDARSAVLAQADIQTALPQTCILMARPVAVNLGQAAKMLCDMIGGMQIGPAELTWMKDHQAEFQENLKHVVDIEQVQRVLISPLLTARLNVVGAIKEAVHQLSLIEFQETEGSSGIQINSETAGPSQDKQIPTFNLKQLSLLDPAEADRRLGVCTIPLYKLSEPEVGVLQADSSAEEVRDVLRAHGVLQYFFPPPDHLALGIADGCRLTPRELSERLSLIPGYGHPFGPQEILDTSIPVVATVDALRERGFLVEGEFAVELSQGGQQCRATVKFQPREGLLAKLSRLFSMKVDLRLRDLLG